MGLNLKYSYVIEIYLTSITLTYKWLEFEILWDEILSIQKISHILKDRFWPLCTKITIECFSYTITLMGSVLLKAITFSVV